MKPIYPRIRFSPLTAARRSLSNTVNVRPKLKKPETKARFPVEGVTYSFNDEAQPKRKRLMGFREWCEQVYEPSKSARGSAQAEESKPQVADGVSSLTVQI